MHVAIHNSNHQTSMEKYYGVILEDLQVTLTCTLMDGYGCIM